MSNGTKKTKPQIVLTLEPMPCPIPVRIRVRQALKTLLRRDRLRCVKIDGDALNEPAEPATPQEENRT